MIKYPCRRKYCQVKQRNGRCSEENWIPKSEETCEKYQDGYDEKFIFHADGWR